MNQKEKRDILHQLLDLKLKFLGWEQMTNNLDTAADLLTKSMEDEKYSGEFDD